MQNLNPFCSFDRYDSMSLVLRGNIIKVKFHFNHLATQNSGERIVDLPIKHSTYYTNAVEDHSSENYLYIGKTEGFNDRFRSLIQFDLENVPLETVNSICIQVPFYFLYFSNTQIKQGI